MYVWKIFHSYSAEETSQEVEKGLVIYGFGADSSFVPVCREIGIRKVALTIHERAEISGCMVMVQFSANVSSV